MKEKFENWLLQVGQKSSKKYKSNTITTYSRAIEKLSEHYSQQKGMQVNIYKLDCLNDYKELIIINKAYSLSGNYSIIGETGHGTYRNAIANYVRFIESLNERNTLEKKEVVDEPMENFKAVKPKYKINLFGIELFPRKEVKNTSETKKELSFDIEVLNHDPSAFNTILPIELIPSDNEVFLETLLKTKKAKISTFYKNGIQENKIWNASRMTAQSNVLGNLRSRIEYRNGNWQKANIVKIVVEVNNNLTSKPIYKKNIEINHVKAITMNKDKAIKEVNKRLDLNLNSNNTNWSNINSSGIWSIEPKCNRKVEKLYLLLNNNRSKKIHAFEIPANHGVFEELYVRDKKGVFRLIFNVSDTEFNEKLVSINFKKFHKGSIEYL